MRMKPLCLALGLALGLQLASPLTLAANNDGNQALLQSAQMWDAKSRPDLARQMLEKFLATAPNSAEGLLLLGELELRSGNSEVAQQLLHKLTAIHPGSTQTKALEILQRVWTQDRQTLAKMRLLARAGRNDEASVLLRQIFPDGPPPGELAIEYYRIIAELPPGPATALRALEALQRRYPGDLRYQMARYSLMARQPETRYEAVRGLARLAREGDLDRIQVTNAWRTALYKLPEDETAVPYLESFLAFAPDEAAMADRLKNARLEKGQRKERERAEAVQRSAEALEEQRRAAAELQRLQADPAYQARLRGLAALENDDLGTAESELRAALSKRPRDPEVIGGLGLVRLREGRHDDARQWFLKALAADPGTRRWRDLASTAAFWGKLKAADRLIEKQRYAEAEALLREALAQEANNTEGQAGLAEVLFATGRKAEAEALYREVLQRDPTNGSALRGLVNLLIDAGKNPEALALLRRQQSHLPEDESDRFAALEARLLRGAADALIAAQQPSQALQHLEDALRLDPRNPWIRYDLARLYAHLGLGSLGDRVMSEGAALIPASADMAYAQALYLQSEDQSEAALIALARIPAAELSESHRALERRAQRTLRLAQVKTAYAQQQFDEADRLLLLAEAEAGDDPELIATIAEQWLTQKQPVRALTLVDALAEHHPRSREVALLRVRLLDATGAEARLARLLPPLLKHAGWTPEQRRQLQRLETERLARQVRQLQASGDQAAARELARAPLPVSDTSLRERARARMLVEVNDWVAALPVLQTLAASAPDDFDLQLDLARAQAETGAPAAAIATLNGFEPRVPEIDLGTRLGILRQYSRMDRTAEVRQRLQPLLASYPHDTELLMLAGRLERAAGRYGKAVDYFQQAHQAEIRPPQPLPAPQASASSPPGGGANLAGLPGRREIPLLEPALVADERLRLAARLSPRREGAVAVDTVASADVAESGAAGGADAAEPALPALEWSDRLANAPQSALLPRESPRQLARQRQLNNAGEGTASLSGATDRAPSAAEQAIREIEARSQSRIESGIDHFSKKSSPGTSSYRGTEIPLVGWKSINYDGHLFVHADQVRIDAGDLPTAYNDSALFGKIQANNLRLANSLAQGASATNFGIGYEQDDTRVDIGVVGQGFLVSNVVGGVRQRGQVDAFGGRFSTSIEAFRRPVTSSLVSYAGARDPATGAVWGGVVATGVSGRASTDLGPYSAFASLSLAKLTGQNTQDNSRVQLRTGIDRDWIRTDDMRVNAGAVLTYWRYGENQGYYTFGHGGYYSPQRYLGLSLPVDWAGRSGPWAYQLKASVGVSRSSDKDMPFYPNDPALQAQAALSPLPDRYATPIYPGGSGGGVSYSLLGATEYRVSPHLALGGRFSIDRSSYYAPNTFSLYMRYMFEPQSEPVRIPPKPVEAYSQY